MGEVAGWLPVGGVADHAAQEGHADLADAILQSLGDPDSVKVVLGVGY